MTAPVFYNTPKSWFSRARWLREFFSSPFVAAAPNSLQAARRSTPHRHDCCALPGCVRHAGGSTDRLISIKIVRFDELMATNEVPAPDAAKRPSEQAGKVEE